MSKPEKKKKTVAKAKTVKKEAAKKKIRITLANMDKARQYHVDFKN